MSARTWKQHRKDLAKPIAATLEVCARHQEVQPMDIEQQRCGDDGCTAWRLSRPPVDGLLADGEWTTAGESRSAGAWGPSPAAMPSR